MAFSFHYQVSFPCSGYAVKAHAGKGTFGLPGQVHIKEKPISSLLVANIWTLSASIRFIFLWPEITEFHLGESKSMQEWLKTMLLNGTDCNPLDSAGVT